MIDFLWGVLLAGIFFGLSIACGYLAWRDYKPEVKLTQKEKELCRRHCKCRDCKLFGECPEFGYKSR